MALTNAAPLIAKGLVLGWSIAWPPGPINSEMIRRGLSRGFWPAFSVGLGACSGDFLWALAVAFGAGALANLPGVKTALGAISLVLLLVLAFFFLRQALRGWRALHRGIPLPAVGPALGGSRGGYLLGLGLALTSPWNIAFWLAVIGHQAGATFGLLPSLLLAAAVVLGAATWGLFLCTAIRLGARFATPRWEIATNAITGLLMIGFAVQLVLRLA